MQNLKVKDINDDLMFVSDSQDVEFIRDYLGIDEDYDSFFVRIGDSDYEEVYGMYNIVPYLEKDVYKIRLGGDFL